MTMFAMRLFGPSLLECDNVPVPLGISGATLDLLRFLCVRHDQPHRRECLGELFWQDRPEKRQRAALNSAVWRLQKIVAPRNGLSLETRLEHVRLSISPSMPVDAHELTARVTAVRDIASLGAAEASRLDQAVTACRQPYLDGANAAWVLPERERLFNIQMRGLTILMRWHGHHGLYEQALEYGRQLLIADPFREAALTEMLWLYVLNGQRAEALKLFQQFRALLRDELDVEPMPETCALFDHIRHGMNGATAPRAATPAKGDLGAVLEVIERSRRKTYEALHALTCTDAH